MKYDILDLLRNFIPIILGIASRPHRALRSSASTALSILMLSLPGLMRHMQPLAQGLRQMDVSRLHLRHAASDHITLDQVKRQGNGAGHPQSHQQHDPGALDASDHHADGAAEGKSYADQNQRPQAATEQRQRPEPAEKPHMRESEEDRARRPQPVNVFDQEDRIDAEAGAQALQLRFSAAVEITILDLLFTGITDQVADRIADE